MNSYKVLKDKHQSEVDAFPLVAAFSNAQFAKAMQKLGLNAETDTDKVCKLGNTGCFCRKSDAKTLHAMFDKHKKELAAAIAGDSTGENFILEMFDYELGNHEYAITYDCEDAVTACGFSMDEINADERLLHGLKLACKANIAWYKEHG